MYIHHLFRSCTFYRFYNKIYDFYLQQLLCIYNWYYSVWNTKWCMFRCKWTFTKLFTPFHFQLKYAEITFFWKNTAVLQFCFSVMDLWPRVSGVFPKWSNIYGVVFSKYKLCLLNIIATDYSDNELYLFVINGVLFIKKIYNSCVSFVFCTLYLWSLKLKTLCKV